MNRMTRNNYSDWLRELYSNDDTVDSVSDDFCREVTLQITNSCNLACTYCYEKHKCYQVMDVNTGKKILDYVLELSETPGGELINTNTKCIIIEFIGGEPMTEVKLITELCDYWFKRCFELNSRLAPFTRISITTNGVNWFDEDVQYFVNKYQNFLSVAVSVDGIKELHDAHRVDLAGNGSFDKAYKAMMDALHKGWDNSKMTFVPDSFKYIFDSVKFMLDSGFRTIMCNYAYEPVYTVEDGRVLYEQLKQVSDYCLDNDLEPYISILEETVGEPDKNNNKNWCGGTGAMICFAPDGKAYPCLRYAPISIGEELAAPMCLGNENGLYLTEEHRKVKDRLDAITKTTQSTEECLNCPVERGCGWCSAYNYEVYGTPDRRVTNICKAHKARSLAVCYYYNKRYCEVDTEFLPKIIYLPEEEAIEMIGEKEYAVLKEYEQKALRKFNETAQV